MRSISVLLLFLEAALLTSLAPAGSWAQAFQMRLIEGVRIDRAGEAWDVTVQFNAPVQIRRHSPAERGETVHVQIALLALPGAPPPRESANVPGHAAVPLESVSYEAEAGDFSLLELRFSRAVSFEVIQGRDLRSVVVRVKPDARPRAQPGNARPALPPADPRTEQLVSEGRRALTSGEFERAALLLQEVVAQPESDQTPAALELLGLARERKGQLAHAKAAYQDYLRRYPDGEGATRVRQRLDAMLTARAQPIPPRREVRSERRSSSLDLESFGSVYIGYHHASQILDELGSETFDSSLYTDLYSDTRLRLPSVTLRSRFSGGYRHQFAQDAGGDETDVGSLYLSFEQPDGGLSGSVGRRTRSTGGVLGRYDGAELNYRGGESWEVGVLGGMPVDSSRWTGFETDRFLGGVNAEFGTFFDSLDIDLFAVGQSADGLLDRAAVGGEIRFFRDGLFAAAYLDYDAYFTSLNVAQVTANWQATPSTTVTGFFDYRNVPFLTTRNAVQGQVGGLSSLESLFSTSEIHSLAEDRTSHATSLNLGISQVLLPRLQLAVDFTASDFSGTETSGGIEGFPGTGWEFSYLAQLIANDLAVPGDIGVASLRYFDGSNGDVVTFALQARVPITSALRVNPRFYTIYQKSSTTQDVVALRPSLRFDYRLWKLSFDAEGGYEWGRTLSGGLDRPSGYFLTGGVRYDF
ncbi:MAG TPA: hypothetical protein VII72_09295 [Myxococcota bacterium]|jgi:hypothetical protein